ncbi:hypothetical protein G6O69_06260 [Pseudenhygromyxa sp. WMMC2535]|uniref:MYXO-CTERM sorting domain-containing protein n=1 Tax=Pseudenhygromyxa sp. WMMC2535 TaxID=2712867 RepID=UPI001555393F|nr:MYXO-CTERM sorting domain-containing protein [Pseudenhygromyxa sp. WMMC2535]NVB37427.1 hypothetical protein [Pseudenhygromyxa sp. WMMC2535]
MRRRILAIVLTTSTLAPAALVLSPRVAEACSCIRTESALTSAREVDLVFTAKLTGVSDAKGGDPNMPAKVFSFEVTRTLKGNLDGAVNVETANNSAACGRDYGEPGSEWLIYARQNEAGTIRDNLCSRSTLLSSDQGTADLAELEANIDSLDGPAEAGNDGPVEPAEPEPEPIIADGGEDGSAQADGGPEPSEPSKRGCAVEDAPGGAGLMGLLLLGLLAPLRRRR